MAQIKCEYCGTLFDPDQGICPLCGIPEEEGMYATQSAPTPIVPPTPPQAVSTPKPTQPRPRTKGGRSAQEEIERAAAKSARSSRPNRNQKKEDKVPAWIAVTICGVLTIAVVLGGGIALLQTDVFDFSDGAEESLSLPYTSEAEAETAVTEDAAPEIVVNSDVECTSLALNYAEVTLFEQGEQLTLAAITTPEEAGENVIWTSADSSICTVSGAGVITAISGGSTTVTASCGDQMATSKIRCGFESAETVVEPSNQETTAQPAEETETTNFTASLNLTDFTLFESGETAQLTVNGAPSSADVTWSIANSAVATVSDSGLVTGLKTGTTKVTCTVGDQVLECYVRCNMINSTNQGGTSSGDGSTTATVAATLSHTDVTISVGESFTLSVNGSTAAHTFTSNNGGICMVDGNGVVTGTGSGTGKITTEVGGETLTCVVRVP